MAKLIRDRSTPEKDAWWRAVQEAAKNAPKLTYERSAPMASEDVLERATKAQRMIPRVVDIFEQAVFIGSVVDDLAAEVRELRKDKARLDWMISKWPWYDQDGPPRDREEIDAAMADGRSQGTGRSEAP